MEATYGIHAINGVWPDYMLLSKMRVAVRSFSILFDHVEGTMGFIAGEALIERAAAAAVAIGGGGILAPCRSGNLGRGLVHASTCRRGWV